MSWKSELKKKAKKAAEAAKAVVNAVEEVVADVVEDVGTGVQEAANYVYTKIAEAARVIGLPMASTYVLPWLGNVIGNVCRHGPPLPFPTHQAPLRGWGRPAPSPFDRV